MSTRRGYAARRPESPAPQPALFTVDEVRGYLGDEAIGMSDAECEEVARQIYKLSRVVIGIARSRHATHV